jgi:hypothetical protein
MKKSKNRIISEPQGQTKSQKAKKVQNIMLEWQSLLGQRKNWLKENKLDKT